MIYMSLSVPMKLQPMFGNFLPEVIGSDEDLHHVVVHILLGGWGWWEGLLCVRLDREPPLQGAAVKHCHICYAVRNVDRARAGQAGRQCHALKSWSAGFADVLTLALVRLRAAVPAARLRVACGHRGGGKHRGGR